MSSRPPRSRTRRPTRRPESGQEEGKHGYLLAIYGGSSTWGTQSEEDAKAELDAFAAFEREAAEAGVLVGSAALDPHGAHRIRPVMP